MKRKNEFVPLYSTQRLIDLLGSINHEISYNLLEAIRYRSNTPISFVDFGEDNDSISFVTASKVIELSNKFDEDYKKLGWEKFRSSMKIGKSIKLIYGDRFPINQPKGTEAPKPKNDIESFVNMFKAERDQNKNYDLFDIVSGEDIRYWYDQENYSRYMQEGCTLAKSCLRYKESLKFLDMYVQNPNIFSMLILKDTSNKLRARSIVWNLETPENRIFMDRVYSINDFDVELFKNYAKERGWLYKTRQTYGFNHNIFDTSNNEEYNFHEFIMKATVKNKKYKHYPYLDTLSVFNRETGELCNDGKLMKKPPHISLIDPQGGYVDNSDSRETVFSNVYGEDIAIEDSVYVDIDDSWVYSDDSVYVHNSGGRKSYTNSPLIVFSNIGGKQKYFLKEDCVFSQYHNTFIYKDSVLEAYLDEDKKDKIITHKRLVGVIVVKDKDGDFVINKSRQKEEHNKKHFIDIDISGDSIFRFTVPSYSSPGIYGTQSRIENIDGEQIQDEDVQTNEEETSSEGRRSRMFRRSPNIGQRPDVVDFNSTIQRLSSVGIYHPSDENYYENNIDEALDNIRNIFSSHNLNENNE